VQFNVENSKQRWNQAMDNPLPPQAKGSGNFAALCWLSCDCFHLQQVLALEVRL